MTSRTPLRRRGLAVQSAAALVVVILTACSPDSPGSDTSADPTTQQSTSDGGAQVEVRGDLPDGFPADDIPLLDGEVIRAGGTEEEGIWIVVVRSDASVDEAREAAIEVLTAAGFAESDDMAGMGVYTDGTYTVSIRAGQQDGFTAVNYSIATVS